MARRWMCLGGVQPVRVVHGDGQVLSFSPPVKVEDILINHPHHYICHMSQDLPSNRSPMLPLCYDLEAGCLYFLLPLPRLFPTSSAGSPSCCCRVSNHVTRLEDGHTTDSGGGHGGTPGRFGFSPVRLKAVRQVIDRIGSPLRTAKKVSPKCSESPVSSGNRKLGNTSPLLSPTYGSSKHRKRSSGIADFSKRCTPSSKGFPNRARDNNTASKAQGGNKGSTRDSGRGFMDDLLSRKWKPRLGCISETDAVVNACEELRLCLDRRRLTFDSKLPRANTSPVRKSPDVYRASARERLPKPQKDDAYYTDRATKHVPLGHYVVV